MPLVVTKIQKQSIEIARAAFPSDFGERRCFHISFLFRKNRLLCFAENSSKTHARNRYNSKWDLGLKKQCSELRLFLIARSKFKEIDWGKMTIVNVRLGRKMEVLNSAPCAACRNLLSFLSPRELQFSTEEGFKNYD